MDETTSLPCLACLWEVDPTIDEGYANTATYTCPIHGPRLLRHERGLAQLSQAALAARLGVSHMTVYRWEKGLRRISDLTWLAIQSVLANLKKP